MRTDHFLYIEIHSDGDVEDIVLNYKTRFARLDLYAIASKDHHSVLNTSQIDSLPTVEKYTWGSVMKSDGGYGKLVINKTSPEFCTFCSIIVMV